MTLLTRLLIILFRPTLCLSRYWDIRQPNPAHVQQLPERCYALSLSYPLMAVGTADRNVVIFNLQNPQVNYFSLRYISGYVHGCSGVVHTLFLIHRSCTAFTYILFLNSIGSYHCFVQVRSLWLSLRLLPLFFPQCYFHCFCSAITMKSYPSGQISIIAIALEGRYHCEAFSVVC